MEINVEDYSSSEVYHYLTQDVVKKSLAFAELALAIKFLSNADLVKHWGVLKREVFIGFWILIAVALALYLLGMYATKRYTG